MQEVQRKLVCPLMDMQSRNVLCDAFDLVVAFALDAPLDSCGVFEVPDVAELEESLSDLVSDGHPDDIALDAALIWRWGEWSHHQWCYDCKNPVKGVEKGEHYFDTFAEAERFAVESDRTTCMIAPYSVRFGPDRERTKDAHVRVSRWLDNQAAQIISDEVRFVCPTKDIKSHPFKYWIENGALKLRAANQFKILGLPTARAVQEVEKLSDTFVKLPGESEGSYQFRLSSLFERCEKVAEESTFVSGLEADFVEVMKLGSEKGSKKAATSNG